VHRQPGNVAWAIWDERADAIAMQQASHKEAHDAGAVKRCDSIEAIARVVGCDAKALAQTFADVAAAQRGAKKDEFGRDFTKKPLLKAPYCVSKIAGALTHTQGGLEVNTEMRVLRTDGTPLPNLFAGGGAARGLSGPSDWGYLSGSGLMTATSMGRLAGIAAAKLVKG
jgi:fumarate reductase flavoprotein subunit